MTRNEIGFRSQIDSDCSPSCLPAMRGIWHNHFVFPILKTINLICLYKPKHHPTQLTCHRTQTIAQGSFYIDSNRYCRFIFIHTNTATDWVIVMTTAACTKYSLFSKGFWMTCLIWTKSWNGLFLFLCSRSSVFVRWRWIRWKIHGERKKKEMEKWFDPAGTWNYLHSDVKDVRSSKVVYKLSPRQVLISTERLERERTWSSQKVGLN